MEVYFFTEKSCLDVSACGGKGSSLARLVQHGFNVPAGFVITSGSFEFILQKYDVSIKLSNILKLNEDVDYNDVEQMSSKAMQLLDSVPFEEELKEYLQYYLEPNKHYAIRSSAVKSVCLGMMSGGENRNGK